MMIKFMTILFAFMLMSSCMTSAANADTANSNNTIVSKKDFIIISAEKSKWFGGRQGVGGDKYTIVVKNNQREISYQFLNLVIGTERLPVKISLKDNMITIVALKTYPRKQSNVDDPVISQESQATNVPNEYYMEYTLGKSKTIKKLKIDSFREASSQENIP